MQRNKYGTLFTSLSGSDRENREIFKNPRASISILRHDARSQILEAKKDQDYCLIYSFTTTHGTQFGGELIHLTGAGNFEGFCFLIRRLRAGPTPLLNINYVSSG